MADPDGARRQAALARYDVFDTPPERDFDDIAILASQICETPIAVVNLVGEHRQWFKAEIGLGVQETPLDTSFCGLAILEQDFLLVPDAADDPRFSCNPLVTDGLKLRFYAGAILKTSEGMPIGTLCVLDTRPRQLGPHQIEAMKRLARQVMTLLELRRTLMTRDANAARLEAILESASDYAIITTDAAGRVASWNKGAEHVFGRKAEAALGQDIGMIFTPEDCAAGLPGQEAAAADASGRIAAERFQVRSDGSRFYAQGTVARLRGEGQAGHLRILRDRTDRRRVEEALRERSEEFSALADNMAGLCWMAKADGAITWYNKRWYEYTGTSPDGQLGWGWEKVHDQALLPGILARWRHAIETGKPFEMTLPLRGADGRFRPFLTRAMPIRDQQGAVIRWFGTNTDITDQVEAERMLQQRVAERTAERDRIWRLSPDLMLVARFDGTITALNPAWTTVLGWPRETLIGSSFLHLVHPDDRLATRRELRALAAGQSGKTHENRYRHQDGSYRRLSWTAVPDNQLIHAIGRDVTAERAAEQELAQAQDALRQAQKMEAVGQLTGGVAHDFNNLLTIIRSSTELLRRPELPEARRLRYVDAIAETVDRGARLTGQLLAFARRQALLPELFDVAERLRAIEDMLHTVVGSRIHVVIDADCAPCLVEADASQFETALVNMAVNGRDAMEEQGTLCIRIAEVGAMSAIRGHTGAASSFVSISVADTGGGIPPDRISQIFEPFYTTKEVGRGTGLGLSQVYGFAKQSGGDVSVESKVGLGTTFTLYLPHAEQGARLPPRPIARPQAGTEQGGGRRVLVVEDNEQVGSFSTQILQDLGYQTVWAANAAEALSLLGGDAAGFDIVFSDVVMPGMSGLELGHEIRRRFPALPVILTSGYSHVLAEEGRHGFPLLQKPYAIETLSAKLREV
jgi:PAS domain S-box-containing protein